MVSSLHYPTSEHQHYISRVELRCKYNSSKATSAYDERDVTDFDRRTRAGEENVQISTKVTPLPGSLHARWVRCGSLGCRCRTAGERHGPYWRRFWREQGRTRSVYVPLDQLEEVRLGIALWQQQYPSARSLVREFRSLMRLMRDGQDGSDGERDGA